MQIIGAQVDGADAIEPMDDLLGAFIVEFFGDADGDGQAGNAVERCRDDAAVACS